MDLARIQQILRHEKLDGWLFYDFRKSNPIAYAVLGLSLDEFYTRRWFYFVPAQGTPTALISTVESHVLRSLPGERRHFRTWQEMHSSVQQRFIDMIRQAGLVPEAPIVGANAHSGNPHYEPTSTTHSPIQRGDLVLLDFWAHLPNPDAVYADYTWVAFAGTREEIPQRQ